MTGRSKASHFVGFENLILSGPGSALGMHPCSIPCFILVVGYHAEEWWENWAWCGAGFWARGPPLPSPPQLFGLVWFVAFGVSGKGFSFVFCYCFLESEECSGLFCWRGDDAEAARSFHFIISSAVAQLWVKNSFTSCGVKDFNSPLRLDGGIRCQCVETGIFLSLWSSWGDLMRLTGQ